MRTVQTLAVAIFASVLGAASTSAAVINTVDRGWFSVREFNSLEFYERSSNGNHIVGSNPPTVYRGFFSFDLSAFTGPFSSARFEAVSPPFGFVTTDPTESLTLFDVTTDIQVDSPSVVFTDLGAGVSYGTITLSPPPNNSQFLVTIDFNADGLAALNAAVGTTFTFGAALTSLGSGNAEFIFGFSGSDASDGNTRLVVEPSAAGVPEPTSFVFWSVSALALVTNTIRRRFRRLPPVPTEPHRVCAMVTARSRRDW